MRNVKNVTVAPDCSKITFTLDTGEEIVKSYQVRADASSFMSPSDHVMFGLATTILELTERLEAIERNSAKEA